jgi:hypothetical protein
MTDAPTKERPAARGKAKRRTIDAKLRARIEQAVEQLIATLDALEAPEEDKEDDSTGEEEPDAEPTYGWTEFEARFGRYVPTQPWNDEEEPSLGAAENLRGRRSSSARWGEGDQTDWASSGVADLEGPNDDLEPSLAFPGALNGTGGSQVHGDDDDREDEFDGRENDHDLEAVNEDGGDVNDEPHDGETDSEPSLGAPETGSGSQVHWSDGDNFGSEVEAGIGPSPATIEEARKRYRQVRSNVRFPDGRMFDGSTGEPIGTLPKAQVGIAVDNRYGTVTLRGPDGHRYSVHDLRER